MRKLQMQVSNSITFEQGCNKYLDNCRQRNLREGTIISPPDVVEDFKTFLADINQKYES